MHLSICYDTIVANKTYFIILLLVEKMDVDHELKYHISSFHQLGLLNKLSKEWLVEIKEYWKDVLQYAYNINEVGT